MRAFLNISTIRRIASASLCLPLLGTVACSLNDLTKVPDPSSIVSPDAAKTAEAGVKLYKGVLSKFAVVYAGGGNGGAGSSFAQTSGVVGDEYTVRQYTTVLGVYNLRTVTVASQAPLYSDLHTVRLNIDQAIGTLRKYGAGTPPAYIGELYAIKGYIYTMFAELYCSGIPFSYAPFEGDIILGQAESTEQMLTRAVALFDSAYAIATDSVPIQQLALVGKARALLNLGQFDEAAAVVTETNVPTSYVYDETYSAGFTNTSAPNYIAYALTGSSFWVDAFMADRAGSNGLDYLSAGNAGDTRVASVLAGSVELKPIPAKFPTGSSPVTLASGIEARLIQAEAALQAHQYGSWATTLNTLRQTTINPAIPALSADSTTGAATDSARVDVMFRERAFWLYGTGHRAGDMRRLIRQYGRDVTAVYPMGVQGQFLAPDNIYGLDVNVPVPQAELTNNPQYRGCINRDA